ncbi:MAG: asparagine synthase (glutamine-hydrolyzing) [Acidobacteria bacterium]|nr:asparagine synthase (glutamine-hydrolyzing) [Acidobacteriota bacterium]
MCGIAGFHLFDRPAQASTLKAMCGLIRHRGPDDEGFHVDGGCGLGMRRLSIIDLETGHQPISNEDGSAWVVFNGEIYNYRELRADLEARGHRFSTSSDTEALVHLYEQEGAGGIARLRGMFAFAIWDARQRLLLLARDRFGKKPLYYAATGHGLYFASELKCLRGLEIPFELDREALRLYFQFGYLPDPASPFLAIRKLAPGAWLTCDSQGRISEQRYWRLPTPAREPPAGLAYEQALERIRELFDEAVRIRMIADVPLGAFLSGGIDSSSVVASMSRQSSEPVKTFSIGFEERSFNELPYAGLVARHYRTDHHQIVVRPDAIDLVQKLLRHFDEPFADASAIPAYIVSEFTSRHVKVALTGDGGDELFAGYESFARIERLRCLDRIPQPARRILSWIADALPYSAYGKNYLQMISRPTALERYFEFNYMPYLLRRRLLRPEWMMPADAAFLTSTLAEFLLPNGADALLQALYFEATANLTGDMLVKVDRMSMAASLEVRCPMLDHHLAEFAFSLPVSWKIRNRKGKAILLDAIGGRLPAGILNRPKMGFGVPLASWFRGPLREFLQDHLTSREFIERGIVSGEFVRHLLNEHDSGRRDNNLRLWALLILELWFRQWESASTAPLRSRLGSPC